MRALLLPVDLLRGGGLKTSKVHLTFFRLTLQSQFRLLIFLFVRLLRPLWSPFLTLLLLTIPLSLSWATVTRCSSD